MKRFLKNVLPVMICLAVLSMASYKKMADISNGSAKIHMTAAIKNCLQAQEQYTMVTISTGSLLRF